MSDDTIINPNTANFVKNGATIQPSKFYFRIKIYVMEKITYDEVIKRIGYFRNQAKLPARETSARLGYNPQFIKTIENKSIELKVRTLLDFCDVVDITPQDFFYLGKEFNKEDKYFLEMFSQLSSENKNTIMELIKKLK